MIKIYLIEPWKLSLVTVAVMLLWYMVLNYSNKSKRLRAVFYIISFLMTAIAIYGVFKYTVLDRNATDTHQFLMVNGYNSEFFREMFMNALLYVPFGLALSVFVGPWVIIVAFLLSAGIEIWQYVAGTGLAQGTDVLMNTLGAVIGAIPVWVNRKWKTKHIDNSKSEKA